MHDMLKFRAFHRLYKVLCCVLRIKYYLWLTLKNKKL